MTQTAAKLLRPVTFGSRPKCRFTLAAGSVVDFEPSDTSGAIRVRFGSQVAAISMDDAIPVFWDEAEEMWVEE